MAYCKPGGILALNVLEWLSADGTRSTGDRVLHPFSCRAFPARPHGGLIVIHDHILQAADYSGFDPLVLSSLCSVLVWLIGKKAVMLVAGRIAGNHLLIGKAASEILRQLDHPSNWSLEGDYIALHRSGRPTIQILTTTGTVTVGKTALQEGWHRLERRVVRVQAGEVKELLAAAKRDAELAKAVGDLI